MKAVISSRYGSPQTLEIRQVERPRPRSDQVLVEVHSTTVTRTDCATLRAHPFFMRLSTGLLRPRHTILGLDFAGTVVEVGSDVSRFAPGERVFGLSPNEFGAHAEFMACNENGAIAPLPEGITFDGAVLGEGAWYAHTYLEKFGLGPGQRILIYGASGAIGTAAVQLAKFRGAEVTAVVATHHLDLAHSLGADQVIDYTTDDFTQSEGRFDFVFDAVGKTTYFRCRQLLEPNGKFSAADLGPGWQNLLLATWSSFNGRSRVVLPFPDDSEAFVPFLRDRLVHGQIRAVIDRSYPLAEIVDAYRYVEAGQKTGIVVIHVAEDS